MEYPDGSAFTLSLLCIPAMVNMADARESLRSSHDSILWLSLCTGPEGYDHKEERERAWHIIGEREKVKAKLIEVTSDETQWIEYTEKLRLLREELKSVMKV